MKMIYHAIAEGLSVFGERQTVWGYEMLVAVIDPTDEAQVTQAKNEGWQEHPQAVIDEIAQHAPAPSAPNITQMQALIDKQQALISKLKQEIAQLKSQEVIPVLALDKMSADELKSLLDDKGISYPARANKEALLALARGDGL